MERKKLHPEGPEFSRIVAGVWRWHTVSPADIEALIHTSLDLGITTFDNADIYGDHNNEELFGNALRKNKSLRKQMELVTKCGIKFPSEKRSSSWVKHYDTSKEHLLWSVDNSLKVTSTDYIDLLLIHRPDPLLDPHEIAEIFTLLKQSGKVLHFGVSNFTPFQFEMLQQYVPIPLVTNQVEISLTCHTPLFDGTLDVLLKHRTRAMAWSPLGGGNLMTDANAHIFENKAEKYQATESQLSLSWLLKHPAVILPVIGTTKAERIKESAAALSINLDRQDWFDMLKAAMGKEMP